MSDATPPDGLEQMVSHLHARLARAEARDLMLLSVIGALVVALRERGMLGRTFLDALALLEGPFQGYEDPLVSEDLGIILGNLRQVMGVKTPTPEPARPSFSVIDGGGP